MYSGDLKGMTYLSLPSQRITGQYKTPQYLTQLHEYWQILAFVQAKR